MHSFVFPEMAGRGATTLLATPLNLPHDSADRIGLMAGHYWPINSL